MSGVTVNFYTNKSDRRQAVKTLEDQIIKTCEFKGDVSVTDPVLIVTGDADDYAFVNYMSIPVFGRSYFCTCRALPGGLIEVTGRVDVLSSAWSLLQNKRAIVARQSEAYNLLLNDGTFQAYANDQVVTKEFSSGFSSPAYVLIVAG